MKEGKEDISFPLTSINLLMYLKNRNSSLYFKCHWLHSFLLFKNYVLIYQEGWHACPLVEFDFLLFFLFWLLYLCFEPSIRNFCGAIALSRAFSNIGSSVSKLNNVNVLRQMVAIEMGIICLEVLVMARD